MELHHWHCPPPCASFWLQEERDYTNFKRLTKRSFCFLCKPGSLLCLGASSLETNLSLPSSSIFLDFRYGLLQPPGNPLHTPCFCHNWLEIVLMTFSLNDCFHVDISKYDQIMYSIQCMCIYQGLNSCESCNVLILMWQAKTFLWESLDVYILPLLIVVLCWTKLFVNVYCLFISRL